MMEALLHFYLMITAGSMSVKKPTWVSDMTNGQTMVISANCELGKVSYHITQSVNRNELSHRTVKVPRGNIAYIKDVTSSPTEITSRLWDIYQMGGFEQSTSKCTISRHIHSYEVSIAVMVTGVHLPLIIRTAFTTTPS